MSAWTGVALARTPPGGDGMHSRLSTYLHPLAGRPLLWHTLSCLAHLRPAAEQLLLVCDRQLPAEPWAEFGSRFEMIRTGKGPAELPDALATRALVVDGAAPAMGECLERLVTEPDGTFVRSPDGLVAAAVLGAGDAEAVIAEGLETAAGLAGARELAASDEAVVVRDRAALARASRRVHDRVVERLMAGGVTFLLPTSVLVDVDVQIGRDTVIYPGAVLEGQTVIGEETVVGPGCRIIDSWIGSGVELKGWNFISRSSVRNRAILEPYVRRGFE